MYALFLVQLLQELDGHNGFVTAIRFESNKLFYTADSEGQVSSWAKDGGEWALRRHFSVPELKGVSINALAVHPSGKRIYISARDSLVRMLDVLSGVVLQTYTGALSHRYTFHFIIFLLRK
jgi:WD40 repeat protein